MSFFNLNFYKNTLSNINFLYLLSFLIAISYFIFNFLDVEDSNVYFNRLNYLQGGDIFIYYNGQIAFLSQLLAYSLSNFSPFFQAFGYMAFSLFSFILFISILSKIVRNNLLILIFVCYLGAFFPLIFYNLTNSIWTGLFITALIPVLAYKENRKLSWIEFITVLVFATSQAPVLVSLPLYLILLRRTGFDFKLTILIPWILLFSLYVMPNWNSERADMSFILKENLFFFLSNPISFFIPQIVLKSDLPSRLVEFVSFFGMSFIFLVKVFKKDIEQLDFGILLFALGILFLAFSSRLSETFFIGPRYFVPSMIFFIILVEPYLLKLTRVVNLISILSIFIVLVVFSDRYLLDPVNRLKDFKDLFIESGQNVVIDRGGGWIIPLGSFMRQKNDCNVYENRSNEDKALIYCGEGKGEILLK